MLMVTCFIYMYCIKVRSCTPFYGTLIQIRYFGTVTVFINDGIPVHVYLEKKLLEQFC